MRRFCSVLLLFFFCLSKGSLAEARDDWEYWGSYQLKTPLQEKLDLKLTQESKVQNDISHLYLVNGTAGLVWKPKKYLSITPSYKFEYEEKSTGKNVDEHRPFLDIVLKTVLDDWKLSYRHRAERRFLTDKGKWRFRNSIKVAHPVRIGGIGGWRFTPFASEEIFYDAKKDTFNQNRATVGISQKLSKPLTLDLFYRVRSDKSGSDWNERHIVGSELKLSF